MRLYKVVAIINYLISGFFGYMAAAGAILGTMRGDPPPVKDCLGILSIGIVFFLIGLRHHMKYRKGRKIFKEFLDGRNIEKIDYTVKGYKCSKAGGYYVLEYYIGGKAYYMDVTKMECRNNENNEYYIRPIYDRKGRVRELVPYMDKKNFDNKYYGSIPAVEHYREMQRLKEESIEKKEDEPVKPKYAGPKAPHVPKIKSKRMKKKYDKK